MKVLIVVASKHGSTDEIANAIAQELRQATFVVEVRHAEDMPNVNICDAVIIGSAIYAESWMRVATKFVDANRAALLKKPVWLFSSGPLGDDIEEPVEPIEQVETLMAQLGARGHRSFVGKLDKRDLNMGERLVVRMVKAPYGDFRNWDEIRQWAQEIAAELKKISTK